MSAMGVDVGCMGNDEVDTGSVVTGFEALKAWSTLM